MKQDQLQVSLVFYPVQLLQGMLKTRPGNRHRGAWEFTPEHRTPKTTSNLQVVINVHLQPLYLFHPLCYYYSTPSPNTSNFSRRSKNHLRHLSTPASSTSKAPSESVHHLVSRTLGPGARTARQAGQLISSWSRNHRRTRDREQGNLTHDHLHDVPPHRVALPGLHRKQVGHDQTP